MRSKDYKFCSARRLRKEENQLQKTLFHSHGYPLFSFEGKHTIAHAHNADASLKTNELEQTSPKTGTDV